MKINYTSVNSPLGPLTLAASSEGLIQVAFGAPSPSFFSEVDKRFKRLLKVQPMWEPQSEPNNPHLQQAQSELAAYFQRTPIHFETKLHLIGTPFQKAVWEAIRVIPYGKTCSYQDIGLAIGNPKGAQAIGQATGHNPIPIIVPCHRVMGKNGAMTGFSAPGGIETKRQLLEMEEDHEGI